MKDSTHGIVQSAKLFLSGTLLSRISGMARDMTMAFAFGTHEAVAAFLVAFRLAHLLRRLFGEGALQTAFIPHFEELRTEDPKKAFCFFRDLFFLLTLGLLLFILTIISAGFFLMQLDWSSGNKEILLYTLLTLPSLLFICLFGINASLLQCQKRYFLSGAAPVIFNLVWIVGVLFLWSKPPQEAMFWLSGWIILACFMQWAITVPQVYRIFLEQKLSFWTDIQILSPQVKQLVKPLSLGILGVAAAQINNALDSLFARYADTEGPAYLWYAIRIQQLPLALFGIAVSSALLPPLSRALKNQDYLNFDRFLHSSMRRCLALVIPITVALFLMAQIGITFIYGRGDFNESSILGTTECLYGYAAGLLPMTLVLLIAPAFYAMKDYKTPAIAATLAVFVNVGLNYLFVMELSWGAASVAYATSLSSFVNLAYLAWKHPRCRYILDQFEWSCLAKFTAAALLGAFGVMFMNNAIAQQSTFVKLISQIFVFSLITLLTSWLLKADDLLHWILPQKSS